MTADRNKCNVGLDLTWCTRHCVFEVDQDSFFFAVHSIFYFRVEKELEALLFEKIAESFAHFDIEERADAVRVLDHCHLGAKALVHASHFETNHTSTDDNHTFRDSL